MPTEKPSTMCTKRQVSSLHSSTDLSVLSTHFDNYRDKYHQYKFSSIKLSGPSDHLKSWKACWRPNVQFDCFMSKTIAYWGVSEQRRRPHIESLLHIATWVVISHVPSYVRRLKPKKCTIAKHVKIDPGSPGALVPSLYHAGVTGHPGVLLVTERGVNGHSRDTQAATRPNEKKSRLWYKHIYV